MPLYGVRLHEFSLVGQPPFEFRYVLLGNVGRAGVHMHTAFVSGDIPSPVCPSFHRFNDQSVVFNGGGYWLMCLLANVWWWRSHTAVESAKCQAYTKVNLKPAETADF
jgi:hypothetical protein